jgi:hypothetical protein
VDALGNHVGAYLHFAGSDSVLMRFDTDMVLFAMRGDGYFVPTGFYFYWSGERCDGTLYIRDNASRLFRIGHLQGNTALWITNVITMSHVRYNSVELFADDNPDLSNGAPVILECITLAICMMRARALL